MEDLLNINNQVTIFCSFILKPDSIIKTIDEMRTSDDSLKQQRAEKIFEIIASYIRDLVGFKALIKDLDADGNLTKVALAVEAIMSSDDDPKYIVARRKYQNLYKSFSSRDADLIIKTEYDRPIAHSDLVFLNQLAAITASTPAELSRLNQFSDRYFKNRIRDLYYKAQYYFEQAFANTDIVVQEKLLEILDSESEKSSRAHDEGKAEEFSFLEELYIVSAIDKKLLKSDVKFTKDKAFDSFLKVLQNKDKVKSVGILLNDDSIMRAIFNYKYDNKGSLSTLKHLFINTEYPYNDILLEKYTDLQNRTEEGLKRDLQVLSADHKFSEAYDKYNRAKEIEILKKDSEVITEALDQTEPTAELLAKIAFLIDAYRAYDSPIDSMLSGEEINGYMISFYEYIVKYKLYHADSDLVKAIDRYFVVRVNNEFYSRKSVIKYTSKTDAINMVMPEDLWYEINRLLYQFNVTNITKVYLKYAKGTYVFEPYKELEVYPKTFLRSDISKLSDDMIGVDATYENIKSMDIYLHRIYSKLIEKICNDKINIDIAILDLGSGFFKKNKANVPKLSTEIYEEDGEKIMNVMSTYLSLVVLLEKGIEFFKDRFESLSVDILRELHGIKKSYKVIQKKVSFPDNEYALKLFEADKREIELLHNDITKYIQNSFTKGLNKSLEAFMDLMVISYRVEEGYDFKPKPEPEVK